MFDTAAFFETVGWSLLAALAVLTAAFGASLALKVNSVVDIAWGLAYVAIAVVAAVLGGGGLERRLLVLALVAVWGGRLAGFIAWRNHGRGEDPRYAEMLSRGGGHLVVSAFLKVFVLQAVLAWFIGLPLVVSAFEPGGLTVLARVGVALWAVGVFFEAVGDQQLYAYKRDPAHRGTTMTTGLWRYTRHPNYFGDACVWTGLFLIAAEHLPGVATIGSLVVMIGLLTVGSGTRITERTMARNKPDFADYAARTSVFFPWRPKRTAAAEAVS